MSSRRFFVISAPLLVGATALTWWQPPTTAIDTTIPRTGRKDGGFVGSGACRPCHEGPHKTWAATFHSTMTQRATPTSVRGRFDGTTLQARDQRWQVVTDRGRFFAKNLQTGIAAEVVQVTGSHHRQVYWLRQGPGNKLAALPFIWDLRYRVWMLRADGFVTPPDGDLQLATWNDRCVHCHTTAGAPQKTSDGGFDTEAVDLGIACESCHGPGAAHVQHRRNPLARYAGHLDDHDDPTIVHPGKLSAARANDVCAQCHSIGDRQGAHWQQQGSRFVAGAELAKTRQLVTREWALRVPQGTPAQIANVTRDVREKWARKRYWDDGEARVTGREFMQMARSPCHGLHGTEPDDQLRDDRRGDKACTGCHGMAANHSRHPPQSNGARCQACHMPHTTWGLLKAVRSHRISSPDIAVTLTTGRPDACTACHVDKSLGWAAAALQQGWGKQTPGFSDPQAAAIPATVARILAGDPGVRALTAKHLGMADRAGNGPWAARWLAELLTDPYPAVRLAARDTLRVRFGMEQLTMDARDKPRERRQMVLRAWQAEGEPGPKIDAALVRRLVKSRDPRPLTLAE